MSFIRKLLDSQRHHFEKGGKLEKFYYIWEANETFLFSQPIRFFGWQIFNKKQGDDKND